MRQVPHYLLIGDGRLSRHFQHYFDSLSISFSTWSRKQSFDLLKKELHTASHILLLIKDNAIHAFAADHLADYQGVLIHCSGSLVSEKIIGVHPLMTFNSQLYPLEYYPRIPFILDQDAPDFATLFPGLPNPSARLEKSQKAKYHALCVMSGNFSCLLWQKLLTEFEETFQLPKEIAHAYLLQQTKNLLHDPATALTGPLIRNDQQTIANNLAALTKDPFQQVYQSFIDCYQALQSEE